MLEFEIQDNNTTQIKDTQIKDTDKDIDKEQDKPKNKKNKYYKIDEKVINMLDLANDFEEIKLI